tara:strand:+ start:1946 stop:2845 length:900 start_codon:yes stop_codon:yes gene_type:complete
MITVGWILNLDADLELADPSGFTPTRRLTQQSKVLADRLLVAANAADQRVRHIRLAPGDHPTTCQAWCATPRAHAAARAIGHELPATPPLPVLQKVNHRAFAAGFSPGLPGAAFVTSTQELDALMQTATPEHGWLLKRPFGFSGRGQKRVSAVPTGRDRRWVEASMVEYGCGLMVEPFVAIDQEFALHSWLGKDGVCLTGQPTRLITDELGAWLGNEPGPALHDQEREQLHAAHAVAARALSAAGFFGPFATDAFRYRTDDGRVHFHALSELNARYSMGFFVGLADCLEEWARRVAAQV